ncbi:MAG: RNA-directed DNA polymerase [Mycobacteriales bacterium]
MTSDDKLDLDAAWRRVLKQARLDFIPDVLRFEDYKLAWPEMKARIEHELASGPYTPSLPTLVEVPKDSFMSRPVTMLRIEDRVVYDAILERLIDAIEAALPSEVHSARVRRRKNGSLDERHGVAQWLGFEAAGLALHTGAGYGFMLTTDVSSYFEYVDIKTLIQDLKTLPGVSSPVVDQLSAFLNHLERVSDVWGLPQGHSASSVLGNFYLLPLDRYLNTLSVKHVRYQDDIRIFANTREELMRVLRGAIGILRGRHLNFAVQKTKLSVGDEILNEFEDTAKNAINYGLEIGAADVAEDLHALFDKATVGKINARDIKFAIVRLARLDDDYAVDWILKHLDDAAFIASQLTDYLDSFLAARPEIEDALRALISRPSADTYPFAVLHAVRLLYRAASLQDATRNALWALLRDSNTPVYVREHVARCLGKHCAAGDLALLHSVLKGTSDTGLKRALLVAITELGGVDKGFLSQVEKTDPELAATCKFLASKATIPAP